MSPLAWTQHQGCWRVNARMCEAVLQPATFVSPHPSMMFRRPTDVPPALGAAIAGLVSVSLPAEGARTDEDRSVAQMASSRRDKDPSHRQQRPPAEPSSGSRKGSAPIQGCGIPRCRGPSARRAPCPGCVDGLRARQGPAPRQRRSSIRTALTAEVSFCRPRSSKAERPSLARPQRPLPRRVAWLPWFSTWRARSLSAG